MAHFARRFGSDGVGGGMLGGSVTMGWLIATYAHIYFGDVPAGIWRWV